MRDHINCMKRGLRKRDEKRCQEKERKIKEKRINDDDVLKVWC